MFLTKKLTKNKQMKQQVLKFNTPTEENGRIYHNQGKINSPIPIYDRIIEDWETKDKYIIGEAKIEQTEDGLYAEIDESLKGMEFSTISLGNMKDEVNVDDYELVGIYKK